MPRPDVPAERESGGPARTGRPRRRPRRTAGDPTSQTVSAPHGSRDAGAVPDGSAKTAGPRPDLPGGRRPAAQRNPADGSSPAGERRRTGHRGPAGERPRRNDRRPVDDGPTPTFTDATGEVAALAERLPALTLADEHRIARRLATAARARDGRARESALAAVASAVDAAEQRVANRRAALPAISYPAELPVSARREDIAAAIRDNQVVIVAGETGSGKTTQIPKICLELGRGVRGMIGHTQPRRLAARTVAARIAEELHSEVGEAVGWKVRFTDQVGENTLVKLMTDGILLAELAGDRMLRGYDTLIIDEAHERSLNIDFILGYLAQLLPRRPDLKVVITSATIDPERFSKHFGSRADRRGLRPLLPRRRPLPARRGPRRPRRRSRPRPARRHRRRRHRAPPGRAGRHPRVPPRRARDPRHRRRAGAPLGRDRHGDPPPLRPPDDGRAAARVRAAAGHAGPPGRARHQRRRDLPDRPRHPLRDRPRPRAHLPLLAAPEGPAAADREDQPGQCEPTGGPLRPRRRRRLHPPLRRGRLRRPPRLHRPGDPAHQPRLGRAADDRARPRRDLPRSRSSTRPTPAR